ncbi:MAG: hypothetical protein ABI251_06550 [Mycobacteriaceae bacterium]
MTVVPLVLAGQSLATAETATIVTTPAVTTPAVATAGLAQTGPFSHSGRWITDRDGRVAITHGVNMVAESPPYAIDAMGFGEDDAQYLADNGFDSVRVGLYWTAVEPKPGVYDQAYLAHQGHGAAAGQPRDRLVARRAPGHVQRAVQWCRSSGLGGAR